MSAPVIECIDLGFRTREGTELVRPVTFQVDRADRVAIIGPNGAGKSTLLRMLAGLLSPSSGDVLIEGRPMKALPQRQRARLIAVVGQTDQPDPRLSVQDYVELGRIPHAGALGRDQERDIVSEALRRTGTPRLASRMIGSLSGGERQRVQLARAIAQQPRILFLDEPTNHLDPRARGELLELVAGLDVAVVSVLHDLSLVTPFATNVAVMNTAQLLAFGPPREVLAPHLVREVFDIDVLRFRHPAEDRDLTVFDIPLSLSR